MFPKGRGRKDNEKDVKGGRLKMGREKQKVGRKKPPGLARPDSCFPWLELGFLPRFLP